MSRIFTKRELVALDDPLPTLKDLLKSKDTRSENYENNIQPEKVELEKMIA